MPTSCVNCVQENTLLLVDDLLEHEIAFWKTSGLELNLDELRNEFYELLLDYKPVLSCLFVNYCSLAKAAPTSVPSTAQYGGGAANGPKPPRGGYMSVVIDSSSSKYPTFDPIAVRRCMSGRRLLEMLCETRIIDGQVLVQYFAKQPISQCILK